MEGGELKKVRRNYSSVLGTVKSIYRGEGVTGFFKGRCERHEERSNDERT